jgi:hypothetical protein
MKKKIIEQVVYCIENKINKKKYVGSAINFNVRKIRLRGYSRKNRIKIYFENPEFDAS